MRRFKHKITKDIVEFGKSVNEYYSGKNSENIKIYVPKSIVENSNDWEEIIDIPEYVKSNKAFPTNDLYMDKVYKTNGWYAKNLVCIINDKSKELIINIDYLIPSTKEEYDAQFKDYEILSFRNHNYDRILEKHYEGGGYLDLVSYNEYSEKQCLDWNYNIYSIKRLSDGEVFTIGDRVTSTISNNFGNFNIEKFTLTSGNAVIVNGSGSQTSLERLKHSKTPLFTTEDGVDVFEGDQLWEVKKDFDIFYYDSWKSYYGNKGKPVGNNKGFSTKEAAEEYIIMNKPCLSLNDLLMSNEMYTKDTIVGITMSRLKELVKQKLNKTLTNHNDFI